MPILSLRPRQPAKLVRQGLEKLRRAVPDIGRSRILETARAILRRMRKPGRKPKHPINWDSLKQMRAYFATDGFHRGIPTKRTDEHVNSFKIVKLPDGYEVGSELPTTKYLVGTFRSRRRSRIHEGWPLVQVVANEELDKLPAKVTDNLEVVAKRAGFTTKKE